MSWSVGDMVAAPYQEDGDWYRARVMEVLDDGGKVDVYFVDYGDSLFIKSEDLLPLE